MPAHCRGQSIRKSWRDHAHPGYHLLLSSYSSSWLALFVKSSQLMGHLQVCVLLSDFLSDLILSIWLHICTHRHPRQNSKWLSSFVFRYLIISMRQKLIYSKSVKVSTLCDPINHAFDEFDFYLDFFIFGHTKQDKKGSTEVGWIKEKKLGILVHIVQFNRWASNCIICRTREKPTFDWNIFRSWMFYRPADVIEWVSIDNSPMSIAETIHHILRVF